ncbi:ABC transporter transmembrane domain-containing protein [Clostridium saccharoperbutylacetonicum]|uniref:ABC transporter transmembrane domain-containing protein n=1 Tax=Clostridium saccharoperbutylacetonicum TaxID=36745 RepID=UPI0039E79CBB
MKMFKMIYKYINSQFRFFFIIIISSIIINITSIVIPYITGKYIDTLILNKNIENIYYYTSLYVICIVIAILLSYINSMIMVKFKNNIILNFTDEILEHIKKLPISFFYKIDAVYLNDRINSDCNDITSFIIDSIINLIINILSLSIYLYYIYQISLKMFTALIFMIPLYVLTYFYFRKPLYNAYYKFKENRNICCSKTVQQIYNMQFIKLQSLFNFVRDEFKNSFLETIKYAIRCVKLSSLFSSSNSIINSILVVLLFFYGGIEIINGRMSIGDLTILNKYFSSALVSIGYFLNFNQNYRSTLVSFSRITDLLNLNEEHNGDIEIKTINTIKLEDVAFNYESRNILSEFNYTFEKGCIHTIIGPNGIGKSTLINIIVGILGDYNGNVLYDSKNIKDINLYKTRLSSIGIVDQSPKFLNSTIRDNVCPNLKIDDETIVGYFKEYGFENLLVKLPQGLDTSFENNNIALSEGEKQKLSLLRALIKEPEVLLLDEPTTYLDKVSIERLKRNLNKLKVNMIVIIVTHDSNFEDIADKVLNLANNSNRVITSANV